MPKSIRDVRNVGQEISLNKNYIPNINKELAITSSGNYSVSIGIRVSNFDPEFSFCDYPDEKILELEVGGWGNKIDGEGLVKASEIFSDQCPSTETEYFTRTSENNTKTMQISRFVTIQNPESFYLKIKSSEFFGEGENGIVSFYSIIANKTSDIGSTPSADHTYHRNRSQYAKLGIYFSDYYGDQMVVYVNGPITYETTNFLLYWTGNYSEHTIAEGTYQINGINLPPEPADDPEIPPEEVLVFPDARVSIVGQFHSVGNYDHDDEDVIKIRWGEDEGETWLSLNQYKNKSHFHRYMKPGSYNFNISYRILYNFGQVATQWLYHNDDNSTHRNDITITIPELKPEVSPKMIYVPSDKETGIQQKGFLISPTEITQGEYYSEMQMFPFEYFEPMSAKCPAENITFYDAILYCNKRSLSEGLEPVYTQDS